MFDWLFEGSRTILVLLGAVAILALAIWWHLGGPWQPLRRRTRRGVQHAESQRSEAHKGPTTSHYGRGFRPLLDEVAMAADGRKQKRRTAVDLESGRERWSEGPGLHVLLLIAFVALGLMGLYWLLGRSVNTDRKDLQRTIERMAESVKKRDLEIAYEHISERFRSPHAGATKDQFRAMADGQINRWDITQIKVSDFEFPDRPDRTRETKVNFQFKVITSENVYPFTCEAVFVWEPPGVWRMLTCRIFDSFHNNQEIDLQGF